MHFQFGTRTLTFSTPKLGNLPTKSQRSYMADLGKLVKGNASFDSGQSRITVTYKGNLSATELSDQVTNYMRKKGVNAELIHTQFEISTPPTAPGSPRRHRVAYR